MEQIKIYSSRKKSFWRVIGCLLFVLVGIYMFIAAEHLTGYRGRSPLFYKAIGAVAAVFFGIGLYVSINQLLKNPLMLIIDKNGLDVNPKKPLSQLIEWKNIIGFSEIRIRSTNIVIINVDNPEYWVQKEDNYIKKNLMKFNIRNFGSPFSLSASSMQINNIEFIKILNENLNKYKNQV